MIKRREQRNGRLAPRSQLHGALGVRARGVILFQQVLRSSAHRQQVRIVRMSAQPRLDRLQRALAGSGHHIDLAQPFLGLLVVAADVECRLVRARRLAPVTAQLFDAAVEIEGLGGTRLHLQ